MRAVKRAWLPLLVVVVLAVGAFAVQKVRGIFGSEGVLVAPTNFADDAEPFDPKVVRYEIFGPEGATVDVNYVDLESKPQKARGVVLPWSITLSTTAPSAAANIVAQGRTDYLGCRVFVDDELREERVTRGTNAATYCIVKSA